MDCADSRHQQQGGPLRLGLDHYLNLKSMSRMEPDEGHFISSAYSEEDWKPWECHVTQSRGEEADIA